MSISALIGGGASLLGGLFGGDAQKDAAKGSAKVQQRIFDTTRGDFDPYRQVGTAALPYLLQSTLGGGTNYWQNGLGAQPTATAPSGAPSAGAVDPGALYYTMQDGQWAPGSELSRSDLATAYFGGASPLSALSGQDIALNPNHPMYSDAVSAFDIYNRGQDPETGEIGPTSISYSDYSGPVATQQTGPAQLPGAGATGTNASFSAPPNQESGAGMTAPNLNYVGQTVLDMGGLNSQVTPTLGSGQVAMPTLPDANVGNAFTAPQLDQSFSTGQVGSNVTPGDFGTYQGVNAQSVNQPFSMQSVAPTINPQDFTPQTVTAGQVGQDFSEGQVAPTISGQQFGNFQSVTPQTVDQQFTQGQVSPDINVDFESLRNDPIYQFIQGEASEAEKRRLSSQGLLGSSAGNTRLADTAMRTAANEVDRYYNRAVDRYGRQVGNQQRLFQGQQAQAGLGLSNAANSLQAGLANQGAGLTAESQRLSALGQQYGQGADNAARMMQSQGMQADLGLSNVGNALRADLANQGAGITGSGQQLAASSELYNQLVGNEARGFDVQQAQAALGESNAARDLQSQLANQGADAASQDRLLGAYGTQYAQQAGDADRLFRAQQAGADTGLANANLDLQGQQLNYGRAGDIYNNTLNQSLLGYQTGVDNYLRGRDNAVLDYTAQVDNYNRQRQQMADQVSMLNQLDTQQYGRLMDLVGLGTNAAAQTGSAGQNYANALTGINQAQGNNLAQIYGQMAQGVSQSANNYYGNQLVQQYMDKLG